MSQVALAFNRRPPPSLYSVYIRLFKIGTRQHLFLSLLASLYSSQEKEEAFPVIFKFKRLDRPIFDLINVPDVILLFMLLLLNGKKGICEDFMCEK